MLVHVDTDFAGNTDDCAALVLVLGWPGVQVVGVTTVGDPDGRRAGYVRRLLALAGRPEVPVAVGAAGSRTDGSPMGSIPDHATFWGGDPVDPVAPTPDAGCDLLAASVAAGATVVAIGPWTNLAALHDRAPGVLAAAPVVAMGGWTDDLGAGLPAWGPARDTNVRRDPDAARLVLERSGPLTLVPIAATVQAPLRAVDLPRLAASGPVGRLLARQARAHAALVDAPASGRAHAALPDDLVGFLHDPLTAATAVGWPGAVRRRRRLRAQAEDGSLRLHDLVGGRPVEVVERVDGAALVGAWLDAVGVVDARVR